MPLWVALYQWSFIVGLRTEVVCLRQGLGLKPAIARAMNVKIDTGGRRVELDRLPALVAESVRGEWQR